MATVINLDSFGNDCDKSPLDLPIPQIQSSAQSHFTNGDLNDCLIGNHSSFVPQVNGSDSSVEHDKGFH